MIFIQCNNSSTVPDKPAPITNPNLEYILNNASENTIQSEFSNYVFYKGEKREVYIYGHTTSYNWKYIWITDGPNKILFDDYYGWYNGDNFTVSIEITAPVQNGDYTIGISVGENAYGTPLKTCYFSMKVVEKRDYEVHYSYVKDGSNLNYDIFANIPTSVTFNTADNLRDIYDDMGIELILRDSPSERREIITTDLSPLVPSVFNDLTWIDALKDYYLLRFGGKINNSKQNYVEIIGVQMIKYGPTTFDPGYLGYSIPYNINQDEGSLAYVFVESLNYILNNQANQDLKDIAKKKKRTVIAAHELGHCRDYKSSLAPPRIWLTDHVNGHNGENNFDCIISRSDRINQSPWNTDEGLLQQQIDRLEFCPGHVQKLLNINWIY